MDGNIINCHNDVVHREHLFYALNVINEHATQRINRAREIFSERNEKGDDVQEYIIA